MISPCSVASPSRCSTVNHTTMGSRGEEVETEEVETEERRGLMEAPQHQDPKFNCLWIISLSEGGDVEGGAGGGHRQVRKRRRREVWLLEKHHSLCFHDTVRFKLRFRHTSNCTKWRN